MGNSGAITHSITPCYEQKSTSLGSHEVFRGALWEPVGVKAMGYKSMNIDSHAREGGYPLS